MSLTVTLPFNCICQHCYGGGRKGKQSPCRLRTLRSDGDSPHLHSWSLVRISLVPTPVPERMVRDAEFVVSIRNLSYQQMVEGHSRQGGQRGKRQSSVLYCRVGQEQSVTGGAWMPGVAGSVEAQLQPQLCPPPEGGLGVGEPLVWHF